MVSLSREKDASILSWPSMMGHYKLLIADIANIDKDVKEVHIREATLIPRLAPQEGS